MEKKKKKGKFKVFSSVSVLSPFSELPGHRPPPQVPALRAEVEQFVLFSEGAALLCGVQLLLA